MKWKNKGHEFDQLAREYQEKYGGMKVYIFGAGATAAKYTQTFKHLNLLQGFVDNSSEKQGKLYLGLAVISINEWLECYKNDSILVVCVSEKYYRDIRTQLLSTGLEENKDFIWHEFFYDKIFPVLSVYEYNQVFLPLVQISLTERCSLKCSKCAHACNLVPNNASDLPVEDACRSADELFSYVDYVRDFVLIGGEPLLYKDLAYAIDHIGRNYRDKIDIFSITTNGTIMPGEDVLQMCKKYNMLIRISNYVKTLPRLKKKHETLIDKLMSNNINFVLAPEDGAWMDYGFDYVNRHGTSEELIEVFDKCNTPCHEIRGSKFYFCVMARSVSENMNRNIGIVDYLDLDKLCAEDKKIVFEYIMGYSDKGYLDMCNYCHGADAGRYPIPVAEQMTVKL